MFFKCYYKCTCGTFVLVEEDGFLIALNNQDHYSDIEIKKTLLLKKACRQLDLYFLGKLKKFNIPLKIKGTKFQKKVWDLLLKIKYGEVKTYKEIAKMVGDYKKARAVGNACNKNKIPIFIPCHRIIGTNGELKGYAYGKELKRFFLELEKNSKNDKV